MDSASLLAIVVEQRIELFDLCSLRNLSSLNHQLKHDLDSEWGWFHRCFKAGFVNPKHSESRKFVVDWRQLYRTHAEFLGQPRRFLVAVDFGDFVIKCPLSESIGSKLWYLEIKSKILRFTGEGVHIHHSLPHDNGAIGNYFLPSETAAFLRALPCDCHGICQMPKEFPMFAVNFRYTSSKGRLGLPPPQGMSLPMKTAFYPRSEISTVKALVSKMIGKEISESTDIIVEHPGGLISKSAGNLLVRKDLRLLEGETLKIEHSVTGNSECFRVRREYINRKDALTFEGCEREGKVSSLSQTKSQYFHCQSPQILQSTRDARQFEFNPLDPKYLLVGRRSGTIALLDVENDTVRSEISVDPSAILGMSWLNRRPQRAVYGASLSGAIGVIKFDSEDVIENSVIGNFKHISSLSINCTDDLLMASGFTQNVSLFDLHTGVMIGNFEDIHENFINILRFSHTMPHVYATSSFDASVKLWDLRAHSTRPTACFRSPTLNVMCSFSPDDSRLVVSGMDDHVYQLSVQEGLRDFKIPHTVLRTNSHTNYRRSIYLAGADILATAGTDESSVRIVNSNSGAFCGEIDLTGALDRLNGVSEFDVNRYLRSPARLFGNLVNRLLMFGRRRPNLEINGFVEEVDELSEPYGEYVQSLRAHPTDSRKLGVLLSPYRTNADSVVAIANLTSTSTPPAPVLHAQGF